MKNQNNNQKNLKLNIVGAGPGSPDLLTLKGAKLLQEATIIIHDRGVSNEMIELFSPSAKVFEIYYRHKTLEEKKDFFTSQVVNHILPNEKVVYLKHGDPTIFHMMEMEANILREHNIEFEIIPGVTSGIALASLAKISFTNKEVSSHLTLMTPWDILEDESPKITFSPSKGTYLFYLAVEKIDELYNLLIKSGFSPEFDALYGGELSLQNQRIILGKLSEMPRRLKEDGVSRKGIIAVAPSLTWL